MLTSKRFIAISADGEEESSSGQVKHVIMINCGGTMDIVEFLDPPDDLVTCNSFLLVTIIISIILLSLIIP